MTTPSQAGNTVVPAILALEAKGMTVEVRESLVVARSELGTFTADDTRWKPALNDFDITFCNRIPAGEGPLEEEPPLTPLIGSVTCAGEGALD